MFRSYTYEHLRDGRLHFVIVDDFFTESVYSDEFVFDVVIRLYEKKGLPVAGNLYGAMLYCINAGAGHYRGSMKDIICSWRIHNPLIIKYESELDKYLVLL